METRIIIGAADPQSVFAQRVMGTFRIAGVESVFVDYRILISRTCHAAVFASLRVVVNGLFTVFCGSRHRSRCFNQFYHRRRSFVVVNGAVQLFIIQLFERWIRCLSRNGAYPCRQYQCSQYSCSAPACAAARTLCAAMGQLRYDDVLMLDLAPNYFVNSIHVYSPSIASILRWRTNKISRQHCPFYSFPKTSRPYFPS